LAPIPLFRRLSEESYLTIESDITDSFLSEEFVDVELWGAEIAASAENLATAVGFASDVRAAEAAFVAAESAAAEGSLAVLFAPELLIPLAFGAAAYGLYQWLAPKPNKSLPGLAPGVVIPPRKTGGVENPPMVAEPVKVATVMPAVEGVGWVAPVRPGPLTPPRRRRSGRRRWA
jgi:hypothetical protein